MRTLRPVVATVMAAIALSSAAPALAKAPGTPSARLQLLPPMAGVEVLFKGRSYISDGQGRVVLPLSSTDDVPSLVRVPPQRLSDEIRVQQARWYPDLRLALDVYRRVRFSFTDRNGAPIDPDGLTSMLVKSTVGGLYRYDAAEMGKAHWLHSERVVPVQARLRVAPIEYSIEQVMVSGTNVVNESQQRFDPNRIQDVRVWLLFFPAEFTVRDAVFGFPIGSTLTLHFPDGESRTIQLKNGRASVAALPRGEYGVSVNGFGLTLSVPIALSRPQESDIMFLSYIDLGAATVVLVAFLVGLPLIGRAMHRRRRLRLVVYPGRFGAERGGSDDA